MLLCVRNSEYAVKQFLTHWPLLCHCYQLWIKHILFYLIRPTIIVVIIITIIFKFYQFYFCKFYLVLLLLLE